jgi:hypothetical protein
MWKIEQKEQEKLKNFGFIAFQWKNYLWRQNIYRNSIKKNLEEIRRSY